MNPWALRILIAGLLLASLFGAMRAHADELSPSQARTYTLLVLKPGFPGKAVRA